MQKNNPLEITFANGTLICQNLAESLADEIPLAKWDGRIKNYRLPAHSYHELKKFLTEKKVAFSDSVCQFETINFCQNPNLTQNLNPRPYQTQALESWLEHEMRGVVVMPTGTGKTIFAIMAIMSASLPTLIHVPTIDLMLQWQSVLQKNLSIKNAENSEQNFVGTLGGSTNDIRPITVTTYDSAIIHMEKLASKFGLLIFDECHHLPGEQYSYSAEASPAPHRLGLTATPERADGKHSSYESLIGKNVFTSHIDEMQGDFLAPYEIKTIEVEMTEDEQKTYAENREIYLNFLQENNINMGSSHGWQKFIWLSSISKQGRQAFKSYRRQKKVSQDSKNKHAHIWHILQNHRKERIIIFTNDNDMAYRIGERFLLPVLTHNTSSKERQDFLQKFRSGEFPVLVTSKVLNEGVDVPSANIAIIVSGSGSVREHVQRLGRILRPQAGKKAYFYELVSKETSEYFVNLRRKKHRAYERTN